MLINRPPAQTGRTEKMLKEVTKMMKQHKKCYILANNQSNIENMRGRLSKMVGNEEFFYYVRFDTIHHASTIIDIKNGRNCSNNYEIFVDHSVFEDECWWLYNQWKRWND